MAHHQETASLSACQTNRETAHFMGEKESRGCTFANHWRNYPFLRMPNIQMEPGPPGSPTLDQMIADVKDGVLVDGTGSFSIDQQRLQRPASAATPSGRSRTAGIDADGDGLHLQRDHHRLLGEPRL